MNRKIPPKPSGRPRVFSDKELWDASSVTRGSGTRRSAQEAAYAVRAVAVLRWALSAPEDLSAVLWLGDPARPETWRWTLLAALGRFRDPVTLVTAALLVAEQRPSAREGAALLRGIRREMESAP